MTILLNDNIISVSAQRGIARYFGKIVDGAIAEFGSEAIICSPQRRDYGVAVHAPSLRFPGSWRIELQDKIGTLVAALAHPKIAYSVYYGDMQTRAAEVFTVYDMMHELTAPPGHPFIAQKRRCLQRAAALLAISYNTARDIQTVYPDLDPNKIFVTQLGVDAAFFEAGSLQEPWSGRPYFLYVGHRTPYKNFMRALEAFGVSGLSKEFDLRVVSPRGNTSFTEEEESCMEKYDLTGCVHLEVSPSDEALRHRYNHAASLIYPSVYEGFGLPILEALASGTLVAASSTSSMPEVGGEAAFYFDPQSVASIAESLRQISLLPAEERRRRIVQGTAWARGFTWERCLHQTWDVFHALAAH